MSAEKGVSYEDVHGHAWILEHLERGKFRKISIAGGLLYREASPGALLGNSSGCSIGRVAECVTGRGVRMSTSRYSGQS